MLINEVKELVQQLAAKDGIAGYFSDTEYSNYCNIAQLRAIDEMVKMLDYNQKAIDLLGDVIKSTFINKSGTLFNTPSDYYRYVASSAEFTDISAPCDFIGKSERKSRLRSAIVEPTNSFPIITKASNGFIVDPSTVTRIELTYVFLPDAPVWAALPATIPPEFDPSSSTDFALSSKFKNYLVREIANMFGIETRDPNLQQATIQNLVEAI